ncbi:Nucleotide-binding alpha-beta plait [Penicillium argentinense]|uniref:Nucleotide-binding alpha-beta plait n=1 Tax=Penicillium argentinense TaxID=1131581 RepID=A0A9W9EY27_9EURO|nr:Nucleotide-binding alpha-beta plait [Penicillium argentinense]KAJ5089965.1 Nucleotide-binding alpha-beta plait [Penicillium argentinense]
MWNRAPPGSQTPSSLPARPPPSANTAKPGGNDRPMAFTAFAPRSVASSKAHRTSTPVVSAPPVPAAGYATPAPTYGAHYQQPAQLSYQSAPYYAAGYNEQPYGASANTYGPAPNYSYGPQRGPGGVDAETEAQIAQWQSAYSNPGDETTAGKRTGSETNTAAGTPTTATGTPLPKPESKLTVVRSGGGQTWTDSTLLEWDPAHFRLFVGNLAGEVTDDSLLKAFGRYTSVQKARVVRETRTQKSKGYGFVSFSDGDDYFKAGREMQGKYIGSHPVLIRRATTEVKPVSNKQNQRNQKNQKKSGGEKQPGSGKVKQDGVKKPSKTKGGMKILGKDRL